MSATVLSDVADVFNGKTPSKSEQRTEGAPVLKIKDVSENGVFKGGFGSFVDQEFRDRYRSKRVRLDDVLVLNAAHNADYVGSKQYRAAKETVGSVATGEWLIARSKEVALDQGYLWYWFQSPETRFRIRRKVKGIHLYPRDVAELIIPLPPLEEQKRIAAILDKADAIRKKRKQALDLLDDFLRATFLDMFGDPVTNPKGWDVYRLSDVSEVKIGPFGSLLHKEDYVDGGVPIVNPSHIVGDAIVPDPSLTVGKAKYDQLASYVLRAGDVVVGRRGEIGRCAVVGRAEDGMLCGTGSLYVRPKGDCSALFLRTQISETNVKRVLDDAALGVTMKNLNTQIMEKLQVILPPRKDQQLFEATIDKANGVKVRLVSYLADAEDLFSSLSQRAFRGEL